MRRFEFCLHSSLEAGASVEIDEATAALSPGIGQADMRAVTYEDGSPLFKDGRLWILMTVRGGGLPHPMQGIYSMNPSVFDIRFEGIILYDRGDGLLRNDLASNIFYDRNAQPMARFYNWFFILWRPGQERGKADLGGAKFSGAASRNFDHESQAHRSDLVTTKTPNAYTIPEARKWRMLLCENHRGYKAVIRESEQWDGPYEKIAGPVEVNSTGTQIQKIGQKRYALFGSADRKVYIYTYPDLKPAGELRMHLPPWNDKTGTRIWPNVIPLPEGYPARYIALMMDRLNFPGMKGANWTYGAMYLYHAHPPDNDRQDTNRSWCDFSVPVWYIAPAAFGGLTELGNAHAAGLPNIAGPRHQIALPWTAHRRAGRGSVGPLDLNRRHVDQRTLMHIANVRDSAQR